MPLGKLDRATRDGPPTLGAARAGAAFVTDARVVATGLLALFHPGPRQSLDPIAPGPRARVAPSAMANDRLRTGERAALQLAVLGGGTPGPVPTTTRTVRGMLATRSSVIGGRRPLSFTYRYVGPTGLAPEGAAAAADTGAAATRLPDGCVDCG